MKHDFHQRKQNRIKHAENQALKNEQESDKFYQQSKDMAGAIPMGQPILVGHHSEQRDRNYRDKIHNTMGKSVAASQKAAYYTEKADIIKSNAAISADDPEAIIKLEQELRTLVGTQDFMKAANKAVRKKDRDGFLKLKFGTPELWDLLIVPKYGEVGFPKYRLTNNGANIRRIEKRIQELKALEVKPAMDKMINGVRIFENRGANRLQLIFEGKPAAEVIQILKRNGFRWCRSESAWQRQITGNAFFAVKMIIPALTHGDRLD